MKRIATIALLLLLMLAASTPAQAARLKDVSRIDGVRANQLIGFGLVGGLKGTGDDPKSAPYTAEAIANMLNSFGFSVKPADIKVKNFAAVIVTADMPAFAKPGDRLDITVSAIGTATSLSGGTLFETLLRGLDGNIYAVCQGAVSLGRPVSTGRAAASEFPTVGRIPNGATIEAEIPSTVLKGGNTVRINLASPDFTTANAVAGVINSMLNSPGAANALDASTIAVTVPPLFAGNLVGFISLLESVEVSQDIPARVVINERTGTVVLGGGVEILPVAVAHQGLQLEIGVQTGFPPAPAPGEAPAITRVTTKDVVEGLNALGATPQDIVAIFQAIEAAGALLGELLVI